MTTTPFDGLGIGERMRVWRRAKGLSQIDLGKLLGIDVSSIRKYELGLNIPGGSFLTRLCAQGVNMNWLLGVDDGQTEVPDATTQAKVAGVDTAELLALVVELDALSPLECQMIQRAFKARCMEAIRLSKKATAQDGIGEPPSHQECADTADFLTPGSFPKLHGYDPVGL